MANEHLSEKVSVNINTSTLSSIDMLVDNGYYSNRSDFINQAVREGLQKHQATIDRIAEQERKSSAAHDDPWFLGVYGLEKRDIEEQYEKGETCSIRGYGVLMIPDSIPDEQLFAVVESITLRGKAVCRQSVKVYYGLK